MAATITTQHYLERFHQLNGDSPKLRAQFTVTLDSSYPTGGEAVDFTAGGEFSAIDTVQVESTSANGYVPQWDGSNILMYEAGADAAALDEVAATTDLSAETVLCTVVGDPA